MTGIEQLCTSCVLRQRPRIRPTATLHESPAMTRRLLTILTLVVAASGAPLLAQTRAEMQAGTALRDQGRYGEAIETFETIVRANPTDPNARFQLAYSVHASGDHERAIGLHRIAASFPQVRMHSLYNLACALAVTGRREEALVAFSDAVDAGFSNADGARQDSELASLEADPRFEEALAYIGVPIRRALDFWVGRWDCYTAGSKSLNGHNDLEHRLDGTAILEHWTPVAGSGGSQGESWNYYDATSGRWKQNWIDAKGNATEFVGRRKAGGILFETTGPDGAGGTRLRRMFVRPIEGPGGERWVQQTGTTSNDAGASWKPEFDLVYVPAGQPVER